MKEITIEVIKNDKNVIKVNGFLKYHPCDKTIKLCLHKSLSPSEPECWDVTDVRTGRAIISYGIEGKEKCWRHVRDYLKSKGLEDYKKVLNDTPDINTYKVQKLYGTSKE